MEQIWRFASAEAGRVIPECEPLAAELMIDEVLAATRRLGEKLVASPDAAG